MNRQISKIFIHEDYTPHNLIHFNDIALIKLIKPVELDPIDHKVAPICISTTFSFTDKIGWVTGYGIPFSGGSSSSVLRQVDVPILGSDICSKYYKDFNSLTQVCAG